MFAIDKFILLLRIWIVYSILCCHLVTICTAKLDVPNALTCLWASEDNNLAGKYENSIFKYNYQSIVTYISSNENQRLTQNYSLGTCNASYNTRSMVILFILLLSRTNHSSIVVTANGSTTSCSTSFKFINHFPYPIPPQGNISTLFIYFILSCLFCLFINICHKLSSPFYIIHVGQMKMMKVWTKE